MKTVIIDLGVLLLMVTFLIADLITGSPAWVVACVGVTVGIWFAELVHDLLDAARNKGAA